MHFESGIGTGASIVHSSRRRWLITWMAFLLGTALLVATASSASADPANNAKYDSHTGTIYVPTSPAEYDEQIAVAVNTTDATYPEAGGFVQMGPGSSITMMFPDFVAADGEGADLRIFTYDDDFSAIAEVWGSWTGEDGDWHFIDEIVDTNGEAPDAFLDLDLPDEVGPIKYVKLIQEETCDDGENPWCIDQEHPYLGFDLDAVEALYPGTLEPPPDVTCDADETCDFEDETWTGEITCADNCTVVVNEPVPDRFVDLTIEPIDDEADPSFVLTLIREDRPRTWLRTAALYVFKEEVVEERVDRCSLRETLRWFARGQVPDRNCSIIVPLRHDRLKYILFYNEDPRMSGS